MRLRLSEEVGKMKVKNRGFPDLKKFIRSPTQGLFDKSDLFLFGDFVIEVDPSSRSFQF